MFSLRRISAIFALAFLLAACGGSSSGQLLFDVSPVVDADVGGLWDGTGTSDLEPGIVVRLLGIVAEDGRVQYFKLDSGTGRPDFVDDGLQFAGVITSSVNAVSGNIRLYAPAGASFTGGATAVDGTLTGDIVERSSLTGVFTAQTGETGDFAQVFSDLYELDSSPAITAGVWDGTSSLGSNLSLTISADGTILGFDANGCVFSSLAGNGVILIDSEFNVYEINLKITNCGPVNTPPNPDYAGLGYIGLLSDPDNIDTLTISVDNGVTALLIEVTRL